ncbi:MAG TPA: MBL fold metallo-hydrolase [Bryobacteraceae bacterium]|nr:MBL fold metallo-hydrolase [Bryobacteraceae bacterium]
MKTAALFLLAGICAHWGRAARTLDVYDIDVEGGKAVLIVSPSGESMLYDVGWPGNDGRDVNRIVAAAKAAGLEQIDYLVISHYDIDHLGDVPLLVSKFPVKHIIDHGPMEASGKTPTPQYLAYAAVRDRMDHIAMKPGDHLPIRGIDVLVVTAAGKYLEKPLAGAGTPNALCATTPREPERPTDVEDNMSMGLLFTFGKFRMLDLADLESAYDYKLMCPNNPIGSVDVYQVNVHGQEKGVSPVLAQALHARVALMGNGPRKGGDPQSWTTLRGAPGLADIWQVHYSISGGKEHNPADDYIANLEGSTDQANWIRLSASNDGSFAVTNTRNGFSKTYQRQ